MILFRADGNSEIGSGHIMRCLALANEAKIQGYECIFVIASEDFKDTILSNGHEVIVLKSNYKKMKNDLPELSRIINEKAPQLVIVDSYFVDWYFMSEVKKQCDMQKAIFCYIDDFANEDYPCHKLVNYNIYGLEMKNKYTELYGERPPQLFLGLRYALLRKEFRNHKKRIVDDRVKNVMISTGGADTQHLGVEFVRTILRNRELAEKYDYHLIIGGMNPDRCKIEKMVATEPNIFVHVNETDMAGVMCRMDVAISAAGTTLYELCATQTPTITYIVADNQILGANEFAKSGLMLNYGDVRDVEKKEITQRIIKGVDILSREIDTRKRMVELMYRTVDGRGAERLLKELL